MTPLKTEVKNSLRASDLHRVTHLALEDKKVFSVLISLAYDKEDVLCWRAIEAMGKAAGALAMKDHSAVRIVVQRLLWSLSEESGGIGWSAPEMLGEIVRNSPHLFADIPPIILSLHEEEMFLKGVLWAMGRIAGTGIGNVSGAAELAIECLANEDPQVRGFAILALSRMRAAEAKDRVRTMTSDGAKIILYEERDLRERTVGDIAMAALNCFSGSL